MVKFTQKWHVCTVKRGLERILGVHEPLYVRSSRPLSFSRGRRLEAIVHELDHASKSVRETMNLLPPAELRREIGKIAIPVSPSRSFSSALG